ncbi:tumor necrosis factor receptor superfamily member 19 [Tachyglossus aculeatus]|uniref:tumor necrosis factor receptor superfamily member 19 n=1 Tax=Tachyglossus aculeatus TaxID=9261 RepID=UPI0018F5AE58|nr:tumor necrosis factor receptor superfamily member 19 [Tachyglossus aculeatus]XP_038618007.1 tumor necrosis factor receptor superfamily member 19 [Tachyglossus aculeatus]XP_038618008.1 tumor necrosis factor receptor superfamily member 19 [Tachyglossus aculeatus]
MDAEGLKKQEKKLLTLLFLLAHLPWRGVMSETEDCREQEFRDRSGMCILCKQCGPGMELSKECGFGYGEDAHCMACRPNRFKEDRGFQKCKPCLDCAMVNRFQKANCSVTSNAVCGDCLPGFYRKTKLGGFQDMECVPCGDPPPPYEPHCTAKVNLVKIASPASSPRDAALAAVICSALATVLLALLILCIIYCKRQFLEKKPSWSARFQDVQYNGSELSCFDRPALGEFAHGACRQCQRAPVQTCRPVHLIPSLCCEETCSLDPSPRSCAFHPKSSLHERNTSSIGEMIPTFFGSIARSTCGDLSDAWPLVPTTPLDSDTLSLSDSELNGDGNSLDPERERSAPPDLSDGQDWEGAAAPAQTHYENLEEATEFSNHNVLMGQLLTQDTLSNKNQLGGETEAVIIIALPTSNQEA